MPIIQTPVLLATAVMEVILTSLITGEEICQTNILAFQNVSHWNNVVTRWWKMKKSVTVGWNISAERILAVALIVNWNLGQPVLLDLACIKCKFSSGKPCRANISECDFPNWYNERSRWCPEDFYVQDKMPCSDSAYCCHKMWTVKINNVNVFLAKQQGVTPWVAIKQILCNEIILATVV